MGGTLNELGDRLEPGHLVQQVEGKRPRGDHRSRRGDRKGSLRDGDGHDQAQPHPGRAGRCRDRHAVGQPQPGSAGRKLPTTAPAMATRAARHRCTKAVAPGASGRRRAMLPRPSTGAVGSVAEGAQHATGEVIDRAGETAQQVGFKLDSFMQASPLAMGAIAIGAGAVVGSILPETSQEREVLGDASRQVTSAVRDRRRTGDREGRGDPRSRRGEGQLTRLILEPMTPGRSCPGGRVSCCLG